MSPSLRALLGALLMTVCTIGLAADPPRDTIAARLRADLETGMISDSDAVLYAAVALTDARQLPERYRAPMDEEGMALIALQLEKHASASSAAAKKPRSVAATAFGNTTAEFSQHFRISYNPDVTPHATIDLIRISLERAYTAYSGFGFYMPAAPNDGLIDVVMSPNPCAVPNSPVDCNAGGIAIPPDISYLYGGDGDPLMMLPTTIRDENAVRATSAHELFHLIQYQMAGFFEVFTNWWVLEGQPKAMEDIVCPSCERYIFSVQQFYANIDYRLDQHTYGAAVFWKFVMQKYSGNNPDPIREFLLERRTKELYHALRYVLAGKGSTLEGALAEYMVWNLFANMRFRPGYYDDAYLNHGWPDVTKYGGDHMLKDSAPLAHGVFSLQPLSGKYVRIRPDASVTSARKVRVTIETSFGDPGDVRGWIVHRRKDGTVVLRKLDDLTKVKEIVTDFSAATTEELFLILSNGHVDYARTTDYKVELVPAQDIAFSMDTTGSMSGSIYALRSTATRIMDDLIASDADFRIAITEFKDFSTFPYGGFGDFTYRADSPFSDTPAVITGGIGVLSAYGGGDWPESQLSGVMRAIEAEGIGPWRSGVQKSIIVMTDAPGHDPEPFTGYTKASVAAAARAGGVTVSAMPASRFRFATHAAPETPIRIYGVVVGGDGLAYYELNELATATGGKVWQTSYDPTDIAAALLEALGEIGSGPGDEPPPPPANRAPEVSGAMADPSRFWPPNGKMFDVRVTNVTDPDGDAVTVAITGILQDERVGKREPDATGVGTQLARIRAQRDGNGNGRVYTISFTATDSRGASSNGTVSVCIPHDQGGNTVCTNDGPLFDSTAF